ncbi:ABC transporter substrate-binding protein [Aquibium oceanicum]|uniref:Peptide ABC transporter n=1 Tax=Aquibium oceanicum TaxID=1670800 RepID=A0A1L3SWG5_9HYPH|nr:ABC transporter substrate-binding protein [Aquibium oceanicum]APH73759.1 peptide ABC transporter [Aquibium oceanicum]
MRRGTSFATTALAVIMLAAAGTAPASAEAVVTISTGQIFRTLDPAKISDQTDYMAAVNLYDALVTVVEGGNLAPELAESWEVSEDAREITFKIRDDANFTDGSPVEANDVIYSLERLLRINQGPANLFSSVLEPGSVTAVDDKTVKFTLSKTYSPFLATIPSLFIVNEEVAKANEGSDDAQTYLATNVAGSGAYLLKSYDRGTGLTIERNKDYFGSFGDKPIEEVRWIVTSDEATVRSLAASGELTVSSPFQAPETYTALEEMGRFEILKFDTATAFMMKLNTQVAPTDDVHIRRALALATDYDTIRDVIYPGGVLSTPLPKAFAEFHADDIPEPKFDMEAAKAEIAKSKYAGQEIPITLGYVANTKFEEEISLLMQSNLEQLGFKVTQQADPWNRLTELATKPETTPALTQIFFGPTYPSPDSMFFTQYHSKAAGTWASTEWVQDPEIDALIDEARGTADVAEQAEIYKTLQHKLVDMQPDVFLLTLRAQIAMDKCLTGYVYVPMQSVPYDFTRYNWLCD